MDAGGPRDVVRLTRMSSRNVRTADEFATPARSILARGQQAHRQRNREVNIVAASIWVEEESGTYSGRVHPHNGYYATDFSSLRHEVPGSGAYASGSDA